MRDDGLLQHVQVGGAAAVVDVEPVGLGVDRDDVRARRPVGARCGGGGGAVCAVDDDGQPAGRRGDGLGGVTQVAVERVRRVDHPADARANGSDAWAAADEFLDAVLGGVVELVPTGAEDLDAVVGHGVVRRRDHHAEIGVVGAGEVGDGGGRQHADAQRVDALTGQARDDGGFEHLAAGPRVTADDRHPPGVMGRAEPRGRRTQRQRQLSGQLAIGNAADTVGTEQSTHVKLAPRVP